MPDVAETEPTLIDQKTLQPHVGAVVLAAGSVENNLLELAGVLIDGNDPGALVRGESVTTLVAWCQRLGYDPIAPGDLADEVQALATTAKTLTEDRNSVVHGRWFYAAEPGEDAQGLPITTMRVFTSKNRRGKTPLELDWTVARLKALRQSLMNCAWDLARCAENIERVRGGEPLKDRRQGDVIDLGVVH